MKATWLFGSDNERRKKLASSASRKMAERQAKRLARKHKARMTIVQVNGKWIVFRARNRA